MTFQKIQAQLVLDFKEHVTIWGHQQFPFKEHDATVESSYYVEEHPVVQQATKQLKKILDAKYKKASSHDIASTQDHLTPCEQDQLKELLHKYELIMDGMLGQWIREPYDIQLKSGAKLYHVKAFPVPRVHLKTFKTEIECIIKIGVLKKVNCSEWAVPCYLISKGDGSTHFINDFHELNK